MLQLDNVTFGFPTRPDFLGPVSLSVAPGDCLAIVGPNGAGKSTLLRLMAGLASPHAGRITLDGKTLSRLPGRERAKKIAFMPQSITGDHDYVARDVVLMGRFPYRSFGLFESLDDLTIAERSMSQTGTTQFADRPLATLSGGETQRVHLAAALAQQPRLLLLDEPTASLDLQHQLSIFDILRNTARHGCAVVVVTHDLNLAGSFCSNVLLLDDGNVAATGPPSTVLTPGILAPVYGVKLEKMATDSGNAWLVPTVTPPNGESP